jgi:hypothetical protein
MQEPVSRGLPTSPKHSDTPLWELVLLTQLFSPNAKLCLLDKLAHRPPAHILSAIPQSVPLPRRYKLFRHYFSTGIKSLLFQSTTLLSRPRLLLFHLILQYAERGAGTEHYGQETGAEGAEAGHEGQGLCWT